MKSPRLLHNHVAQSLIFGVVAVLLVCVLLHRARTTEVDVVWGQWLGTKAVNISSIQLNPMPEPASRNCRTIEASLKISDPESITAVFEEMRGDKSLHDWFKGLDHWGTTEAFRLSFVLKNGVIIPFVVSFEKDGKTAGYCILRESGMMYVSERLRSVLIAVMVNQNAAGNKDQ